MSELMQAVNRYNAGLISLPELSQVVAMLNMGSDTATYSVASVHGVVIGVTS